MEPDFIDGLLSLGSVSKKTPLFWFVASKNLNYWLALVFFGSFYINILAEDADFVVRGHLFCKKGNFQPFLSHDDIC